MGEKVTMRDIAREMNVSAVTVSKAMANKDGVGKELREAIIKKAAEMGYVYPSPASQNDNGDKTGNIGILIADHFLSEDAFYTKLYKHVLVSAGERGYSTILEVVTPECERNRILPQVIRNHKVDGIIFLGQIDRDYIVTVAAEGLPFVFLDFYDETYQDDAVVTDNLYGAYQLTDYLIKLGHRRIGFIGSINATSSILDRYLGMYKALIKNGLDIRKDWLIEDRNDTGRYIDVKLPTDMPDAFVCNNDEIACTVVGKLKASGYRVPEDVSIVGFDDHVCAVQCEPKLTTYHVDVKSLGEAAASAIIRKIRTGKRARGMTVVCGSMIERDSVAELSIK